MPETANGSPEPEFVSIHYCYYCYCCYYCCYCYYYYYYYFYNDDYDDQSSAFAMHSQAFSERFKWPYLQVFR